MVKKHIPAGGVAAGYGLLGPNRQLCAGCEIPEGVGSVDCQQVVKVPAGTVGTGEAYEIAHTLGKLPCEDVYVKSGDKELYRVNDVKVTLIGTTKVVVNVNDRTIPDVRETGMAIVLN